ncbi:iron-sulfur cluster assembly protein [Amycolatopsis thermoflava]|uniref:iron-sulfur cluster assembly protein n=1 Tax=Amycolatopsis thermoflava TaxID=84480 RepID=UPI003D7495B3
MTTMGILAVREQQARVVADEARVALEAVRGLPAVKAVAKLRLGPGRTCEPVARVIDKALARADAAGIAADQLVVAGGSAEPAEDIVRVRRKAHGIADWISSPTADVSVELQPAGLYVTQVGTAPAPPDRPGTTASPQASAHQDVTPNPMAETVREALYEVIDPDLGVNIVDLGFVRDVVVDDNGVATITMTLTSAACPLTEVMEDQIRTVLLTDNGGLVSDFLVEWVWVPTWRPADISAEGREQLRAIGFTKF